MSLGKFKGQKIIFFIVKSTWLLLMIWQGLGHQILANFFDSKSPHLSAFVISHTWKPPFYGPLFGGLFTSDRKTDKKPTARVWLFDGLLFSQSWKIPNNFFPAKKTSWPILMWIFDELPGNEWQEEKQTKLSRAHASVENGKIWNVSGFDGNVCGGFM